MARITTVQSTPLDVFPTIEHRVSIAKNTLDKANINSKKICAVLSTGIDVYTQPSDSIAIASGVGATHALATSINNSCASVSAAIDIATHQINKQSDKVVVITSSSIFKEIHRDNNINCANGVGAAIISNQPNGLEILKIKHESNAKFFGLKTIEPINGEPSILRFNEKKSSTIWEDYRQSAIDFPVAVLKDALEETGWSISDISHWIFHSSELTKQWCTALGVTVGEPIPNMGPLSTLMQLNILLKNNRVISRDKLAVIEIGLGMSVSVILLQNGENLWTG